MIVKPASATPLTMLKLAEVFAEAGLPEGVLQVITSKKSREITEALMGDARLRKISFTGSTAVGKGLVAQSAENLQRVSMEPGGNAQTLVFDDADVYDAIVGPMIAKIPKLGRASIERAPLAEKVCEYVGYPVV